MHISVLGAGYVGLCTAVSLAKQHEVTLVDVDEEKIDALSMGLSPFFEPGLEAALQEVLESGRLRATTDASQLAHSNLTFICVGTPQAPDGATDLSQVEGALWSIANHVEARHGVVIKSTVPPGTSDWASGFLEGLGANCWMAMNPEFLREGCAVQDALHPDRIVVGGNEEAHATLADVYADATCPIHFVSTRAAEMTKYASNALLAARLSAVNELANIGATVGVDWYEVADIVGADHRIGAHFLRAGAGFGGSCFPKDLKSLRQTAQARGQSTPMLDAVLAQNDGQAMEVIRLLRNQLGTLEGKRIALLGLAFKPDTDDVRESRAEVMWKALRDEGALVICHDPQAMANFQKLCPGAIGTDRALDALKEADAALFQTEWSQYQSLTETDFLTMKGRVIVDGRRSIVPPAGFHYVAIGAPARQWVLA